MSCFLGSHRLVVFVFAFVAVSSQPFFGQSGPAAESSSVAASLPQAPVVTRAKQRVETTVSLGAMAQLTATRMNETSSELTTQSLSPSAGVFGTFRQSYKPWLGYSVNFGYTRATYRLVTAAPAGLTGQTVESFVPNNVYETSVSYIAQKHLTGRLSAFGEAGGGALIFASANRSGYFLYKTDSYRPEGIAGFGMDYRLGHGFAVRAEYRALFFKYPDYGSGHNKLPTVNSSPTVSVVYQFGKR